MTRGLAVVVAVAASLMVACAGHEVSPGQSPPPQDDRISPASGLPIDFETIGIGQLSGIGGQRPQVFKIDTEVEWEEFWSRHQADVMPAPPLPAVDFSEEMVIAAVDEQEPSGGYRLEITAIEEAEDGLLLRVTREKPGRDCIVTAAITQPFHIVRTARSGMEPRLAISEETHSCG